MHPGSRSFTTTAIGGLLNTLKNSCGISLAFDPTIPGQHPSPAPFDAIWDTGATNSVITQEVVDTCGLAPVGITQVHGVNSSGLCEIYLVNVYLPNDVAIHAVRVTKSTLPPGVQLLIGMDIISFGDFAVTNKNGITKFSFRVPSETHIDFVEEHKNLVTKMALKRGGTKKQRPKRHKQYGKNKGK
jgi:hypothetical protein